MYSSELNLCGSRFLSRDCLKKMWCVRKVNNLEYLPVCQWPHQRPRRTLIWLCSRLVIRFLPDIFPSTVTSVRYWFYPHFLIEVHIVDGSLNKSSISFLAGLFFCFRYSANEILSTRTSCIHPGQSSTFNCFCIIVTFPLWRFECTLLSEDLKWILKNMFSIVSF